MQVAERDNPWNDEVPARNRRTQSISGCSGDPVPCRIPSLRGWLRWSRRILRDQRVPDHIADPYRFTGRAVLDGALLRAQSPANPPPPVCDDGGMPSARVVVAVAD